MPKCYETWTILPHRPIEKLEANLWRVEGDLPGGHGNRVMTIARRHDGGLVIHNAISLEPELMAEIEAFGRPTLLVVPNGYHRLDAKVWKQRYPDAQVACPGRARKKVEQVVAVDVSYAEAPQDQDVRLEHLPGTRDAEGAMTVRSGDVLTFVVNDMINNLPKMRGPLGFVFAPTGEAAIPRFARWLWVRDKRALVQELDRVAALPGLRRIIVSHGAMIEARAPEILRTVADRLRA